MTTYEVYNEQTGNTITHPIDLETAIEIALNFENSSHNPNGYTYALRIVDISPDLKAIFDLYRDGIYHVQAYLDSLHIGPRDAYTPALRLMVNAQLDWMDAQNVHAGHEPTPAPRLVRFAVQIGAFLMPFVILVAMLSIA